ncbi:MAG: hypothetical protein ACTSRK_18065 [Promethearchaeota archaeon]
MTIGLTHYMQEPSKLTPTRGMGVSKSILAIVGQTHRKSGMKFGNLRKSTCTDQGA